MTQHAFRPYRGQGAREFKQTLL